MNVSATYTGTVLGEIVTDTRTGEQAQQVFEYQHGQCVDRYVTVTRYRNA